MPEKHKINPDKRENNLPENIQQKNMLFDFYGNLLTEKQREFFIRHYMDDLSLAEIGLLHDITPQAVADLLKRAAAHLEKYEKKLGLINKFDLIKNQSFLIRKELNIISRLGEKGNINEITQRVESISNLLDEIVLT